MLLPTHLLPSLGLSYPERLAILAAATHLVTGATYLAYTGISHPLGKSHREDIGTSKGAVALAATVWMLGVLLWPVPLAFRAIRSLHARRTPAPDSELIWRQSAPAVAAEPRSADVVTSNPAAPTWPPRWYRESYEEIRAVLAEGRSVVARERAAALVDDALTEFGVDHPYTRHAWELLGHVVTTAISHLPDDNALAGTTSADPLHTVPVMPRQRTTSIDADQASVYATNTRDDAGPEATS